MAVSCALLCPERIAQFLALLKGVPSSHEGQREDHRDPTKVEGLEQVCHLPVPQFPPLGNGINYPLAGRGNGE